MKAARRPRTTSDERATGVPVGVLGRGVSGRVDAAGRFHAGGSVLSWAVGTGQRWHRPEREPTRRQVLVADAPVVETRIRVAGGDVVQRVYGVADGGGGVMVEVHNASPTPVALATWGMPVVASRPPLPERPDGVDLPADAVLHAVTHRTTLRLGVVSGRSTVLGGASHEAVARGWRAQADRGWRAEVPDAALMAAARLARCCCVLEGAADLASMVERWRIDAEAPDVLALADAVGRWVRDGGDGDALAGAAILCQALGESRAAADAARLAARAPIAGRQCALATPWADPAGVLGLVRRRLVLVDDAGVTLLPGFDEAWAAAPCEAYDIRIPGGAVSFAVRWHGPRPALLWELDGAPRALRCGLDEAWSSQAARGEVLLRR